ncbi:hypothetical protein U27_06200 [Candidatus Vecturithrix granuli]|uniref:Uncharacterized protein n=1 Tax=Vecturithrix granuli TaxID=1499967 RepID=A0A081C3R8_VECG1|nr:hypothetical protein U27_06200 [Candidatus Vecturithrix granuli]
MDLFSQNMTLEQKIFHALFFAPTEDAVDEVFLQYPQIFQTDQNWYPLGGNESNFGVIENQ